MGSIHRIADSAEVIRTAVIQGNINQADKWTPGKQVGTLEKYFFLSQLSDPNPPELIVWPETAAPFYFGHHAELTAMVTEGVRKTGAAFLIGCPFAQPDKQNFRYFNSAFLISPNGEVTGRYDKTHLVPFGEYVPFQQWLPFIGRLVEAVGDFERGDPGRTLAWSGRSLGVLICYEQIFPYLSRHMARNGADILVSMTNDAWYGNTAAPYQHFSMAVFRAVENRRSLARAANTGISGFIDPTGQIISQTRIYTDATLIADIPVIAASTIYTRYGDFFAILCLIGSGLFMAFDRIRLTVTTKEVSHERGIQTEHQRIESKNSALAEVSLT
jgi:apolipoprotein N-acyltransferase